MYLEYCMAELCIHPPPPLLLSLCPPAARFHRSPLLLPSPLMSDVISSQPGMAAASGSNLVLTPTQFLCPHTLTLTPCQKSAELQIKIWPICLYSQFYLFFLFLFSLYQTAKFRLMLKLSHSRIYDALLPHVAPRIVFVLQVRKLEGDEVTAGMMVVWAQV